MTASPITLDDCRREGRLHGLEAGDYSLEYHDSTHLLPDEWVRLATISIHPTAIPVGEGMDERIDQYYTLRRDVGDLPEKPALAPAGKQNKGKGESSVDREIDYGRRLRTVNDAVSLALARLGLLAPAASDELIREVISLNDEDGVVLIPDTNALHNGAMHWLLRALPRPAIWVLPLVASMTTVQTRDATLKSLVARFKPSNLRHALRSRGLVNGALGLIERNRGRVQVVEIDPSLLRYQKTASSSGSDPDQSDVLEDRLIIEGIHGVLRSMRSRTARRVVTSDVNIARVLSAEGVDVLFVPTIALGDEPLACLRYDPLMKGFVGAPIAALLWEFAHAFGTVRIVRGNEAVATFACYWPEKLPSEWRAEKLACSFGPSAGPLRAAPRQEEPVPATVEPLPVSGPPRQPATAASEGKAAVAERPVKQPARKPEGAASRPKAVRTPREPGEAKRAAISTVLPRASLPQMFQLLGAMRRLRSATVDELVAVSRGEKVTVDTARRGLEILRRARLLEQDNAQFTASPDADLADTLLRQNDLDGLSAIFSRFEPYRAFSEELQARGRILRAEVVPLLKARLGAIGSYEGERLPRYHILFGQAWTDGDMIRDGSKRPTDRDATDAFEEAFAATASVGLAKVSDLLPRFCTITSMSPWAAKRRIERFVADRLLPDYSFQPAAGGKPLVRDEVLAGSLEDVRVEPVIIDRLHLGERPVFTIGGPAR